MKMLPETPLLKITDLHAYYGAAHVLQGVELSLHRGSLALIGRNGMGKTTLCNAIMRLQPPSVTGSIQLAGQELLSKPPHKPAQHGIGYVPQGRRLFQSLTVDEHLRLTRTVRGARWHIDAVFSLFPRLADRRSVLGTQLSGGEQQMLAIGRALLTNPTLLIMDEPSEGLAPAVVHSLVTTFRQLAEEGLAILVVEQNLSVAAALADRQLVMLGGRIVADVTSVELMGDPDAQRRWLGVESQTSPTTRSTRKVRARQA